MYRATKDYPTTIDIDGEQTGFRIKRLTADEWLTFGREFEHLGKVRAADEYELRPRDEEERALTADDLQAKRWLELTPEDRIAREAARKAHDERGNVFGKAAIMAYVTAEPDQVFDEEKNAYVTDGEDLVRVFGSRPDVMSDLVAEIFLMNRLTADQKKKLKLLRASPPISTASSPEAGKTPAPIAASVEPEASVEPAAVTDVPSASPSGPMETLN